jgi:hypothetical protein
LPTCFIADAASIGLARQGGNLREFQKSGMRLSMDAWNASVTSGDRNRSRIIARFCSIRPGTSVRPLLMSVGAL